MNGNSDGMINPLMPKTSEGDMEPFDENLVEPVSAPNPEPVSESVPVNFSRLAQQPQSARHIPVSQPAFEQRPPVAPAPAPVQPAPSFEPSTPVTSAPAQKKKSNMPMILGIILIIVAIGCAVGVILVSTVFKPKTNSGDSGNSGNSGGNSENTSKYASAPDSIDSCPGCVYAYPSGAIVFNPDYNNASYKAIESSQYKTSWKDVVTESEHEVFLGFTLDSNNMPLKMYACGIANSEKPFCLEGTLSDKYNGDQATRFAAYQTNVNTLNTVFSKTSSDLDFTNDTEYKIVQDGVQALTYLDGSTMQGGAAVYDSDWVFCTVNNYGTASCNEYWTK